MVAGRSRNWWGPPPCEQQLKQIRDSLKKSLDDSRRELEAARSQHYCLQFLVTRQVWGIVDFLRYDFDEATALRVRSSLRLYRPSITAQAVRDAWQLQEVNMDDLAGCFESAAGFVEMCERLCPLPQLTPFPRLTGMRTSDSVEHLLVAAVNSREHAVNVLFSLCMTDGRVPARSQVLFCSPSTTLEEVLLLVERCRHAKARGFGDRLFYIVHAELLQYELQVVLSGLLRQMEREVHLHPFRLAVICCRQGVASEQSQLLADFAATLHPTSGLQDGVVREAAAALLPFVFVVTSEAAGLGKSEFISLQCYKRDLEPRLLTVTGALDAQQLVRRIEALGLAPGRDALHIDIGPVDSPHALNIFLLELLLLRTVCAGDDVFTMPDVPVFVEVGTVAGAPLLSALSFCRHLPTRNLLWSLERVVVSMEPSSVDQLDIAIKQAGLAALPLPTCRALLSKHFFEHERVARRAPYTALQTFLRVLGYQLVRLSRSPFFRVAHLRYATQRVGAASGTRSLLVRSLVDMAAEFASLHDPAQRAAAAAAHGTDEIEHCVDRFSRMIRWSAAENNHLFVLFHPAGSLTALYRDPGTVPETIRSLLQGQDETNTIPSGVSFLAACNPYKRRSPQAMQSQAQAGLKLRQRDDPMSRLVYRVHPLPERLADFVWDFGSLSREDETRYVRAMVLGSEFLRLLDGVAYHERLVYQRVVPGLLVASQEFVAKNEAVSAVSLRDVNRCIFLMAKFLALLRRKRDLDATLLSSKKKSGGKGKPSRGRRGTGDPEPLEEHRNKEPKGELPVRAVVLALAHCYYCRLPTRELRDKYAVLVARELQPLVAVLQRSRFDERDVKEIVEGRARFLHGSTVRSLATAYHNYQREMRGAPYENFHGLRDYYSLVKSLARAEAAIASAGSDSKQGSKLEVFMRALQRNFGGLAAVAPPERAGKVISKFLEDLNLVPKGAGASAVTRPPVLELIRENWLDTEARPPAPPRSAPPCERRPLLRRGRRRGTCCLVLIAGSAFPDDAGSEEYAYRVLSRVILSMEAGNCVILKDLNVYGALYDMLNQHYSIGAGDKRYCRVALGAFTSPPCHVDELFRCVVVVDRDEVELQDPPFLNRFEKQVVSYEDILTDGQRALIRELSRWARDAATCALPGSSFTEERPERSFCGFNEDTLPSLARLHLPAAPAPAPPEAGAAAGPGAGAGAGAEADRAGALERCKGDLVATMTEDCAARLDCTRLGRSDAPEAARVAALYAGQEHRSLARFLDRAVEGWRERPEAWGGAAGVTAIVYTFSQPTSAPPLGAAGRRSSCWARARRGPTGRRCPSPPPSSSSTARPTPARGAARQARPPPRPPRPRRLGLRPFSHLGQWRQVAIDALEPPAAVVVVGPLRGTPVAELLAAGRLDALLLEALPWSLAALRYRRAAGAEEHVRAALALSASLEAALLEALRRQLRGPLAKVLLQLEREELLATLAARPAPAAAAFAAAGPVLAPGLADVAGLPPPELEGYEVAGPAPARLAPRGGRPAPGRGEGGEEEASPSPEEACCEELRATLPAELAAAARAVVGDGADDYARDFALSAAQELAGFPSLEEARDAVLWLLRALHPAPFADALAVHCAWWAAAEQTAACLALLAACAAVVPVAEAAGGAFEGGPERLRVHVADRICRAILAAAAASDEGPEEGGEGGGWLRAARYVVAQVAAGGPFEVPPTAAFQLLRVCAELAPCLRGAGARGAREARASLLREVAALGEGAGPEPLASAAFVGGLLALLERRGAVLDGAALERFEAGLFARCLGAVDPERPREAAPLLEAIARRLLRPDARLGAGAAHALGALFALAAEEHEARAGAPAAFSLGLYGTPWVTPRCWPPRRASPPWTPPSPCTRPTAPPRLRLRRPPPQGPFSLLRPNLSISYLRGRQVYARVGPAELAAESVVERAVAECLVHACRLLEDPAAGPLATACAAAFLRAACAAVAPYWAPGPAALHGLGPHVARAFESALAGASERARGAQLCLLRAIRREAGPVSAADLRAWCTQSLAGRLGWLQELPWRPAPLSRLDYDPFAGAEGHYDSALRALEALAAGHGEGPLEALLKEAAQKPAALLAAAQATLARFLLSRAGLGPGPALEAAAPASPPSSSPACGAPRCAPPPASCPRSSRGGAGPGACAPPRAFLELSPGCEAADVHLAALFAHWAALLAAAPPAALPFSALFAEPARVAASFVPGAPSGAEAAAARALGAAEGGRGRWYTHSCGFRYFVANCGRPMERAACPNPACAGAGALGGAGHTPEAGNAEAGAPEERPGLPPLDPAALEAAPEHTERGLHPAAFRILRLLSSLALAASAAAGLLPAPLAPALFRGGDASRALEAAAADAGALCRLFDADLPALCLALHGLLRRLAADALAGRAALPPAAVALGSAAGRAAFERAFEAAPPAARAPPRAPASRPSSSRGPGAPAADADPRLPRTLAAARAGTAEGLRRAFLLRPELRGWHPALALLLDAEAGVERVRRVAPLARWSAALARRLEHAISREKAQQQSVRQFLESRPALEPLFEAGRAAWEEARPGLQGPLECVQNVPPAPEATLDSPLSLFLPERRDTGVHVCMALDQIAGAQNALLHAAAALARGGCAALAFLPAAGPAFGEVAVQDAAEADFVELEARPARPPRSRTGPRGSGPGSSVLTTAPAPPAQRALAGRRLMRMEGDRAALRPFVYHLELFPTSGTVLEEIGARVRQEALPPGAEAAIRADAALAGRLERAMQAMEVVLGTLNRGAPRWSEDLPLSSFGEIFEGDSAERWLLALPALRPLALRHACALYETLEGAACEARPPRPPPPPPPHSSSLTRRRGGAGAGAGAGAGVALEELLLALRRFIYRYLAATGGDAAAVRQPLASHLAREDLWRRASSTGRPAASASGGGAPAPEALAACVAESVTCAHRITYGLPAPAALAAASSSEGPAASGSAAGAAARLSAAAAGRGGPLLGAQKRGKRKYA
eukprot:tig00000093_g3504.t1